MRIQLLLILSLGTILLQGCGVIMVSGAATGVTVAQDRRTAGTIVDDKSAEVKALHNLSENKTLWKSSHITPVCYNGVLVLVGQVPSPQLKQDAELAVSDIPKIRRIHNELTIEEPTSLGTRSQDTWITTQIKAKIVGSKVLKFAHIKVVTENSIVYLMGITTPEEAMVATDIAKQISGVEKIIQIFEPVN